MIVQKKSNLFGEEEEQRKKK